MARRNKGCYEFNCLDCRRCKIPSKDIMILVGLAVLLATGVMLNILACALFAHGWWTFFVVFAYIGAPLPDLLCKNCTTRSEDDEEEEVGCRTCCILGWQDGAYFVTGFLLISGLALPLVLAHNLVVGLPTMIMSLIGGLCIYVSVACYLTFVHGVSAPSEDEENLIEMY